MTLILGSERTKVDRSGTRRSTKEFFLPCSLLPVLNERLHGPVLRMPSFRFGSGHDRRPLSLLPVELVPVSVPVFLRRTLGWQRLVGNATRLRSGDQDVSTRVLLRRGGQGPEPTRHWRIPPSPSKSRTRVNQELLWGNVYSTEPKTTVLSSVRFPRLSNYRIRGSVSKDVSV